MKNLCSYALILIFFTVTLWFQKQAFSQTLGLHGQLSGWATSSPDESLISQAGLRYIPDILVEKTFDNHFKADAEISLNTDATGLFNGRENTKFEGQLKPYRVWVRFSGDQFETRLGLQKINLGSATLFRPLMWFDRIDPRDPLRLTDGVYGLLLRYYFLNNANIWFWGLYGNDEIKGWEVAPTTEQSVEYGGRVQTPLFKGEVGLTYHHRQADFTPTALPLDRIHDVTSVPEDRLGLDGKWDIGVGLWFEGALIHQKTDFPGIKYRRLWTVGVDYTFGVGNGLSAVGEYFNSESADQAFSSGEGQSFSALSMNYPLGLVDNVSAILYYDWENQDWYRTVTWQRTYDNWSFYLIGFWNPEELRLNPNQTGNNPFAGKGLQFMVVFNH